MDELRSIEAEQAVLAIALNPHRTDEVMGAAKESYFSHERNRLIFAAMKSLYAKSVPVEIVSLIQELRGSDPAIGGYVSDLSASNHLTALDHYLRILRDYELKRRLYYVGSELMELIKTEDAAVVLESTCSKLMAASEAGSERGPRTFSEIFLDHGPEIFRRADNEGKINGIPTGYTDIDYRLNGMKPGDLIIVAARPSMGKTSWALDICKNVALAGYTTLVFSMEMSDRSLIEKILSSVGKVETKKIKDGRLFDDLDDGNRFNTALGRMQQTNLLIDDRPALSPTEVRSASIKVQRKYGKVDLVMVDYLQLMRVPGCKDGRTAEISEISRSLKALAKELNCPVIALSQLNRGVESRPDKRPVNSDLRESGAIEQDADLIAMLYRDDYYNPDSNQKGITEVIWRKFREGEVGTDYLVFIGKYSRFESKAPGWMPDPGAQATQQSRGFSYAD